MRERLVQLIENTVNSYEDQIIKFTQSLVQIPTENPPGKNYLECAEFLGKKMKEIGCDVEYVNVPQNMLAELAPDGNNLPRINVMGKYKGETERPLLHFNGHYDVVHVGPGWSVDPFGGTVEDGKIYGRCSTDQKSGLTAQIFAIQAIKEAGINLRGSIVSSATPDEETGGEAGVGYLVDQGYLSSKNTDYCIITECLDVDKICLGHRGQLWLEIETKGKQSHGCMPSEGINAIGNMQKLLNAISSNIEPELSINSKYPVMPPACRKGSLTVTRIHAGTGTVDLVPNSCKATFDWRLIPEQSVSWAKEKIISLCDKLKEEDSSFDYELKVLHFGDPTVVSDESDLVKSLQKSGKVFLGKPMSFSLSPGYYDQSYIVQKGNLDQCVAYGPGILSLAHQTDEYVLIEDIKIATKILALTAVDLLDGWV